MSDEEDAPRSTETRCVCGRAYSCDTWHALPLCGRMRVPRSDEIVDLRACTCGSALEDPGGPPRKVTGSRRIALRAGAKSA